MDRFDYQTRPFRGARGRSVAALALALFGLVVGREALAFAEDIVAPGTLLLDVDTVVDSTDANPTDGVCADSQGRCSLRAAVQEFNAFGPEEGLIRVPGGTHALELVGAGELFSATGDLNVTGGVLRIDGSGDPANPTIIQGTASWDDRLISVAGTSDLTIENMVLRGGNAGGNGGAVWAADTSSLTLRGCWVTGNTAAGNGGGVAAQGIGLTVERCRISANQAGTSGGGLYIEATAAVIRDTTIDGNGAGPAGGGLWAYSESRSVAVVNSTVSGNQATNGGGILSAGNVGLYSVTVTANLAESVYPDDTPHGGGLYASGFTELRNSIVAGNAAGDAATLYSEDCYGDINDLRSRGYNLLGDWTGCGIDNDTGDLFVSGGIVDARLGPLQDNGGGIPTHALLEGSPAIDAANPNGCMDETLTVLTTDQRGFDRPVDGDEDGAAVCDMGAVEVLVTDSIDGGGGGGGGGCTLSRTGSRDASLPLLLMLALAYLGLRRRA